MTDDELYAAYRAGDEKAFESLYARHSGRVYGYLLKRLGAPEVADEVFQAAFLKLHRSRATLSNEHPFLQSLFVIVRSALLDHIKKEKASRETLVDTAEYFSTVPAPEQDNNSQGLESPLLAQLAALPDAQRRAIQLRVLDEFSYEEIARQLNQGQPAIRQMISRGLKRLRSGVRK